MHKHKRQHDKELDFINIESAWTLIDLWNIKYTAIKVENERK